MPVHPEALRTTHLYRNLASSRWQPTAVDCDPVRTLLSLRGPQERLHIL